MGQTRVMNHSIDDWERWAQRSRFLEAVSSAIARRNEVMEVVFSAESPEAARRTLMDLLEIDEVSARGVLELQIRRFTISTRAQIEAELREHRQTLSAWDAEH